jgi:rare lipoprotein A (peptidoglycan hydrolase)
MTQLVAAGLTLAALFSGNHQHRHHHRHHRRHHHHQQVVSQPLSYATASWYYDGGNTASGFHATYGVANRYLAFGTRVLFVYGGRRVTAVVDDRGPYIYGRTWDLNQNTAGALGFSGVATVGYRIGG